MASATSAGPAASGVEYSRPRSRSAAGAYDLVANLAAQDWLVLGYIVALNLGVWFGSGAERPSCLITVTVDLLVLIVGLLVVRGNLLPWRTVRGGRMASVVYQATILGVVGASYGQLRTILPIVSSRVLDAALYDLDLRLFGFEPSVSWDRFVTPASTEWFAFFYFSHFAWIALYLSWFLFAAKGRIRYQFSLGALLLVCVGHVGYMLVPGYGPYRYLAHTFRHELTGGPCWQFVVNAVDAYGPQKDIFPSLHTATPSFFVLFSYCHRKTWPLRHGWLFLGLITSQIIIATMFLRWHYLIDIVAGLVLAGAAVAIGNKLGGWEYDRRKAADRQPPLIRES